MTKQVECDVTVVGLGPSGMMAVAFLLQRGWRVAAIERHAGLYGLPRAGHVDHEIVRFLQELKEVDAFLEDAYPVSSYRWFNGKGQTLLEMNWGGQSVSGFNSDYMMYQPVLEDCLQAAIDRHGDRLSLLRGHEVSSVEQHDDGVSCRANPSHVGNTHAPPDSEGTLVKSAYFLAGDGARSTIRQQLGIGRADLGFNEVWLDVDVRVLRPLPAMDPHQVCDPRRPIFISPLGKRHHRFEWAILPGEAPADFAKPETAWSLLALQGVGPDDVEIVRQQVYTFEARVAERWQQGRVFLIGDAAHTMPPFMGQGACSGMRDAVNLAWKLDLVLSGAASPAVLGSYQVEREPHTRTWIDLSIRTGEVSCTLDQEQADARDRMLLNGELPPMPPFPDLTSGLLDLRGTGRGQELVGTFFPQREVSWNGESGWIDDVVGTGFRVVTWNVEPSGMLDAAQIEFLSSIGARNVVLCSTAMGERVVDTSGYYERWFAEGGFDVLIVRPDHYIFGVAEDRAAVGPLVDTLRAQLVEDTVTITTVPACG